MTLTFALEDFDAKKVESSQQDVEDAYARGFAEGMEAGKKSIEQTEQALLSELVQTLSDFEIRYDEARLACLAALSPLFDAIVTEIAPESVDAVLHAELMAAIEGTAEQDSAQAAVLTLASESYDTVAPLVAAQNNTRIRLESDASLARGQAKFQSETTSTLLDAQGVVRRIQTALTALQETHMKESEHG